MMIPLPHQIEGAKFLADRAFAILGDDPRCGKTGCAIMAADMRGARTVLVVTTASGRGVWKRGFDDWSLMDRPLQILTGKDKLRPETRVAVVGWPSVADAALRTQLLARDWDVLILDECHYGKSFEAKRTQAVFGVIGAYYDILKRYALVSKAGAVWGLSGTPMPNSPFDLYPILASCALGRLAVDPARGWPDVTVEANFKKRYCEVKPKKIGNGYMARWIDVIVGGKNLSELAARIDGLMLRRTQQDVGIRAPIYETLPLLISDAQKRKIDAAAGDARAIMAAVESGETKALEMHLGPLRRITGGIKAEAVIQAVKDEFDSGLDRVVLAYWHRDVAEMLIEGLGAYGVVGIDGATPAHKRDEHVRAFQSGKARVFLGQIQAAAEAIDLSAAAELIFVESSFQPAHMKQMSLRVTNHTQTQQVRVRVATLEGSIDDAIQNSLLRKWAAIREVLQ